MCDQLGNSEMCMDCKNELNISKLCVRCIKAKGLLAKRLVADDLCALNAKAGTLSVDKETVNSLCVSGSLSANMASAQSFSTNSLCAVSGTINSLCVNNLQLGNFVPSVKYRATVNYSANTTYTLGAFLNFDNIIDDPNGNISLSPNTSYTAPLAGYYMMTFKVNVTNVVSTNGPILGVPVANPEIYVNGIVVREAYSPFITFFNTQKVIVDSLITLQLGDVVTMKYNILAGAGIGVAGSVDILGTGIEDGNSFFKIIFLSSLSSGSQPMCVPCQPVALQCGPIDATCDKAGVCHFDDMNH